MRSQLFGTGGATVSGLFNGAPGNIRGVKRSNRRGLGRKGDGSERPTKGGGEAVLRSPVLACVAQSLAPARSTHEMSNFLPRMQRCVAFGVRRLSVFVLPFFFAIPCKYCLCFSLFFIQLCPFSYVRNAERVVSCFIISNKLTSNQGAVRRI